MALAVTLLVGAGLLIRSFQQVADGAELAATVSTVPYNLPVDKYPEPPNQARACSSARASNCAPCPASPRRPM